MKSKQFTSLVLSCALAAMGMTGCNLKPKEVEAIVEEDNSFDNFDSFADYNPFGDETFEDSDSFADDDSFEDNDSFEDDESFEDGSSFADENPFGDAESFDEDSSFDEYWSTFGFEQYDIEPDPLICEAGEHVFFRKLEMQDLNQDRGSLLTPVGYEITYIQEVGENTLNIWFKNKLPVIVYPIYNTSTGHYDYSAEGMVIEQELDQNVGEAQVLKLTL